MCFTVGNEVDLVLPLLLLQPVFGAAVVAHAAAAQNEDDGPHQPEPCAVKTREMNDGHDDETNITVDQMVMK